MDIIKNIPASSIGLMVLGLVFLMSIMFIIVRAIVHKSEPFSPYGTRMTKKKGEPCEYPDECESLACSGHMGQDDMKTCAY
jgi:hypothetical protein